MKNEWQPISGYEGRYEVSQQGIIRSVDGSICGQWKNSDGYMLVRLSGPRKQLKVSRIVASAFVDNPNCYPVVNHIDNQRSNDNYSNLEWCTQRQNLEHAERQGRMCRDHWAGKRSPNARLSDETASNIKKVYLDGGTSMSKLALRFNCSKRTVLRIIHGESYGVA